MPRTLFIKNMVCNRCKTVVLNLLHAEAIQLGKVVVTEHKNNNYTKLENRLNDLVNSCNLVGILKHI